MNIKKFKKYRKHLIWVGLGIFALLLHFILSNFPVFVENVYSNGIFQGIRYLMDYTVSLSPIPLFYILLGVLLFFMGKGWWKGRKKNPKPTLGRRLANIGMTVLAGVGGAIFFFYLLWGFNYNRIPLEEKLGLEKREISLEDLELEVNRIQKLVIASRQSIPHADTSALTARHFPKNLETTMRRNLVAALQEMKYPTPGRVRGRRIFPKGLLIAFGASGIYIPFVSEGHVDASLLPVQLPPVLAHEMGHGYGFTDEGVCNLLGYLACEKATEPAIQYTGRLNYWRHLARALYRADQDKYIELQESLPPGIIADLKAMKINGQKYQPLFPGVSRAIYDSYLKGQGISEGILSYDRIVELVISYNEMKNRN